MEFFEWLGRFLSDDRLFYSNRWAQRLVGLRVLTQEEGAPFCVTVEDLGPRPEWEQEQAEERAKRWPPLTDPLLFQVIAERRAAGLY